MVYKINLSIQLDKISITTFSYFCFYSRTIPWNIDRENIWPCTFPIPFLFIHFFSINSRTGSQPPIFSIFIRFQIPDCFYQGDNFLVSTFLHPSLLLSHPLRVIIIRSASYLYRYIEIPMYRMCNSSIIASSGRWHNTVYS